MYYRYRKRLGEGSKLNDLVKKIASGASSKLSDSTGQVIPWERLQLHEAFAGKGCGFGTVFRASLDGKVCALRRAERPLLSVHPAETLLEQTSDLMALRHAHLARIFGFASDLSRNHGVLSEYASLSLATVLVSPEAEQLTWSNTWLRIASEIADGMAYLHSMGMAHLALRAENVLLDNHFTAKLTDFGRSAKAVSVLCQNLADGGAVAESPHVCFAPELVRMESFETPVDIWAYGCILAHIGTGKPVYSSFGDASFFVVMLRVCSGEASPLLELEQGLAAPDGIIELARRCTDLEPRRRPTCSDIKTFLGEVRVADFERDTRFTDVEGGRSGSMEYVGNLPSARVTGTTERTLEPVKHPVGRFSYAQPLPVASKAELSDPVNLPHAPKVDLSLALPHVLPRASTRASQVEVPLRPSRNLPPPLPNASEMATRLADERDSHTRVRI